MLRPLASSVLTQLKTVAASRSDHFESDSSCIDHSIHLHYLPPLPPLPTNRQCRIHATRLIHWNPGAEIDETFSTAVKFLDDQAATATVTSTLQANVEVCLQIKESSTVAHSLQVSQTFRVDRRIVDHWATRIVNLKKAGHNVPVVGILTSHRLVLTFSHYVFAHAFSLLLMELYSTLQLSPWTDVLPVNAGHIHSISPTLRQLSNSSAIHNDLGCFWASLILRVPSISCKITFPTIAQERDCSACFELVPLPFTFPADSIATQNRLYEHCQRLRHQIAQTISDHVNCGLPSTVSVPPFPIDSLRTLTIPAFLRSFHRLTSNQFENLDFSRWAIFGLPVLSSFLRTIQPEHPAAKLHWSTLHLYPARDISNDEEFVSQAKGLVKSMAEADPACKITVAILKKYEGMIARREPLNLVIHRRREPLNLVMNLVIHRRRPALSEFGVDCLDISYSQKTGITLSSDALRSLLTQRNRLHAIDKSAACLARMSSIMIQMEKCRNLGFGIEYHIDSIQADYDIQYEELFNQMKEKTYSRDDSEYFLRSRFSVLMVLQLESTDGSVLEILHQPWLFSGYGRGVPLLNILQRCFEHQWNENEHFDPPFQIIPLNHGIVPKFPFALAFCGWRASFSRKAIPKESGTDYYSRRLEEDFHLHVSIRLRIIQYSRWITSNSSFRFEQLEETMSNLVSTSSSGLQQLSPKPFNYELAEFLRDQLANWVSKHTAELQELDQLHQYCHNLVTQLQAPCEAVVALQRRRQAIQQTQQEYLSLSRELLSCYDSKESDANLDDHQEHDSVSMRASEARERLSRVRQQYLDTLQLPDSLPPAISPLLQGIIDRFQATVAQAQHMYPSVETSQSKKTCESKPCDTVEIQVADGELQLVQLTTKAQSFHLSNKKLHATASELKRIFESLLVQYRQQLEEKLKQLAPKTTPAVWNFTQISAAGTLDLDRQFSAAIAAATQLVSLFDLNYILGSKLCHSLVEFAKRDIIWYTDTNERLVRQLLSMSEYERIRIKLQAELEAEAAVQSISEEYDNASLELHRIQKELRNIESDIDFLRKKGKSVAAALQNQKQLQEQQRQALKPLRILHQQLAHLSLILPEVPYRFPDMTNLGVNSGLIQYCSIRSEFECIEKLHDNHSLFKAKRLKSASESSSSDGDEAEVDDEEEWYVLKEYRINEEQTLRKFQRSVEFLVSVQHPNILPLSAIIRDDDSGNMYLQFPLYQFGTLRDWMLKRPPNWQPQATIRQLLLTLSFLHSRTPSVAHRDIKPENILMSADGSPLLCDFDFTSPTLSSIGSSSTTSTATSFYYGTDGYRDPALQGASAPTGSMISSQVASCNSASDVYAFGVVCHEIWMDSRPALPFRPTDLTHLLSTDDSLAAHSTLVQQRLQLLPLLKRMLSTSQAERPSAVQLLHASFFNTSFELGGSQPIDRSDQLRNCIASLAQAQEALKTVNRSANLRPLIAQFQRYRNNLASLSVSSSSSDPPPSVIRLSEIMHWLELTIQLNGMELDIEKVDEAVTHSCSRFFRIPWQFKFVGELGMDYSGLTKAFYDNLWREVLREDNMLFEQNCDGGLYLPRAKANRRWLFYCGALMAKCLLSCCLVDCSHDLVPLCLCMLQTPTSIRATDSDYTAFFGVDSYLHLSNLRILPNKELRNWSFSDMNPADKRCVTHRNVTEYIEQKIQHELVSSRIQSLMTLSAGFRSVDPGLVRVIEQTPAQLLPQLIGGVRHVDLKMFLQTLKFIGFSESSRTPDYLRQYLSSLSSRDLICFVFFVTSTRRFSSRDSTARANQITVTRVSFDAASPRFPVAHTCFRALDLPDYEDVALLTRMMTMVLHESDDSFGLA